MIQETVTGMVLAACFLRYMDALKLGDHYASDTSRVAWHVAALHISGADMDRMTRMWEP